MGEEAETTYKLSLKIQGPEAHWIVAFRSIADKTQWQNALIAQVSSTLWLLLLPLDVSLVSCILSSTSNTNFRWA